jgi:L-fuconolactonase
LVSPLNGNNTVRIDAHHHFWKIGRYEYPWLVPDLKAIYRDFGAGDLQPELARSGIDRTVLVQTISSLEETKWFLALSCQHSFIAGVVGWVDLRDPAVGDTLDELLATNRLVGIRHQVHDEPDANWLLNADVQRGLRELTRRGVPYDLLVRPPHLAASLQIAREHPNLSLVVDHIAKPRIAQGGWDDWAGGLAALAQCPNVWCKLSGMITEADWANWRPADLKPYVEHVVACFGVERVLFGSDWPVCLLAGSYDRVLAALESCLADLNPTEREKVFGTNAVDVYRLKNLT